MGETLKQYQVMQVRHSYGELWQFQEGTATGLKGALNTAKGLVREALSKLKENPTPLERAKTRRVWIQQEGFPATLTQPARPNGDLVHVAKPLNQPLNAAPEPVEVDIAGNIQNSAPTVKIPRNQIS